MRTLARKTRKQKERMQKKLPNKGSIYVVTSYKYFDPDVIAIECLRRYRRGNKYLLDFRVHHGSRDDVPDGLWWSVHKSWEEKEKTVTGQTFLHYLRENKIKPIEIHELAKYMLAGVVHGKHRKEE